MKTRRYSLQRQVTLHHRDWKSPDPAAVPHRNTLPPGTALALQSSQLVNLLPLRWTIVNLGDQYSDQLADADGALQGGR